MCSVDPGAEADSLSCDLLVGIHGEDPVLVGVLQRPVASGAEVLVPVTLHHDGPRRPSDLHCGVSAPGVIDDDLVHQSSERAQALTEHVFLVLDDEHGAQALVRQPSLIGAHALETAHRVPLNPPG